MDKRIIEGIKISKAITKHNAKTFYFCSLFLRKEKREACYCVYALARLIDDTFDKTSNPDENDLERWRHNISEIYGNAEIPDPVFACVREVIKNYGLPRGLFDDLLNGMEMDMRKQKYEDFHDLYLYCYRVAGVIGLILIRIFGYSGEEALKCAEKMGIAMQLTNILRDIKEDLDMGRSYLPSRELGEYDLTREALISGNENENLKLFMKFQISRARGYYKEAFSGLNMITDKNARLIARLMGVIYSGILDVIERNDYNITGPRNFVPLGEKLFITTKVLLKRNC